MDINVGFIVNKIVQPLNGVIDLSAKENEITYRAFYDISAFNVLLIGIQNNFGGAKPFERASTGLNLTSTLKFIVDLDALIPNFIPSFNKYQYIVDNLYGYLTGRNDFMTLSFDLNNSHVIQKETRIPDKLSYQVYIETLFDPNVYLKEARLEVSVPIFAFFQDLYKQNLHCNIRAGASFYKDQVIEKVFLHTSDNAIGWMGGLEFIYDMEEYGEVHISADFSQSYSKVLRNIIEFYDRLYMIFQASYEF